MTARTPQQIDAFTERAEACWQEQGGRRTQVRDVICRVIGSQAAPFDAEELLREVRKVDRVVSMASVYRTLAKLVEAGALREIPGARGTRCYVIVEEVNDGMSSIVCTDCEQVVVMDDGCLPLREGFLARQLGFYPKKMSLRIEASCEELRVRGECQRRKRKPGHEAAPEHP